MEAMGPARCVVLTAVLACALALGSPASADLVTGSWTLTGEAIQGNPMDDDSGSLIGSAFPFTDALSLTAGRSTNLSSFSFSTGPASASFGGVFDFTRDGSGSSSVASAGEITFTLASDATFDLTGGFDLTGFRGIDLFASLVDVTDPLNQVKLFENSQQSVNTLNESLVLGGTSGDSANLLSGAATGNLLGGHTYEFDFEYTLFSTLAPDVAGDPSADGNGFFQLNIGDTVSTAVPAPAAVLLAVVGFGIVSLRRRRDRLG